MKRSRFAPHFGRSVPAGQVPARPRIVWAYGGHAVGEIVARPDGPTFVRHVKETQHIYRRLDGWPAGQRIMDQLEHAGCQWLEYRSPLGVSRVTFDEFKSKSIALDFEHERQHVLPRRAWRFTPTVASVSVEQIDLFTGEGGLP